MNIDEIIDKKNNKKVLTKQEIQFFVDEYVNNKIDDAKATEFLKAVYDKGLNLAETTNLTMSMAKSGEILDLSSLGECVDKHSTGGVSDTTTLVIVPVLASLGVKVAKMSGRSLGWTGGTADKVEVFDGYNNNLTDEEFKNVIKTCGGSLISQSEKIAIADKKIYALRDKTGLVDNTSLIASSIMSKKIACGAKILLLDVKYGEGAFMQTSKDAKKLAVIMCKIGKRANIKTCAIISNMNEPLSKYIGNNLEVYSALKVLSGEESNLTKLCRIIVATILKKAGVTNNIISGEHLADEALKNGKALEKLKQIVAKQGGSIEKIENPNLLLESKNTFKVVSKEEGIVSQIKCKELGNLVHEICKQEQTKQDKNMVGLILNVNKNDFVKKGDLLVTINYANCDNIEEIASKIEKCFVVSGKKGKEFKLVKEIIL